MIFLIGNVFLLANKAVKNFADKYISLAANKINFINDTLGQLQGLVYEVKWTQEAYSAKVIKLKPYLSRSVKVKMENLVPTRIK